MATALGANRFQLTLSLLPVRTLHNTLLALLLFGATLFLFTRENKFPFFYHPDESSKVAQLQTSDWNYHHPMLLLSSSKALITLTGENENAQRVGEAGRFVSALLCAGAVLCLSLTVGALAGRFAAVAAGLLLITNHQLFELAHYLKEDTALFFGISAWFLSLALFWKRPSLGTAAFVGAGAALALSGKYIGAFAPIFSLFLVPYRVEKGARGKLFGAFLITLLGLFALINLPLLLHYSQFKQSLDREVNLAVKGHRGLTRSVPHVVYFTAFKDNIFFALWLPIAWFYVMRCWFQRKALSLFEWLFALFPVAYLLVLSFIPKTNDRYFLPATGLFLCAAALGIHMIRQRSRSRAIGVALVTLGMAIQLPDLWLYYAAFNKDDLRDLTEWLNRELPAATIAVDRRVMLPSPRRASFAAYQLPLKAKVVHDTVEKFDSIDEMRAEGVTHVVLSETTYGRYYQESLHPTKGNRTEFKQRQGLYHELMGDNPPLWGKDRPRSTVIYMHPGLQVYALPPDDNGAKPNQPLPTGQSPTKIKERQKAETNTETEDDS